MGRLFMTVFAVLCLTGCATGTQQGEAQMSETKTYMIITARLHDREAFLAGYAKANTPLVAKYGGRYVMMGPGAELLEGDWGDGTSVVISEWENRDAVKAYWNSDEYAEVRKLREGIADVQVLVIDAPKFAMD